MSVKVKDFGLDNMPQAVLEEYGSKTEDPRLREIMLALITHLHEFVKEVELTEADINVMMYARNLFCSQIPWACHRWLIPSTTCVKASGRKIRFWAPSMCPVHRKSQWAPASSRSQLKKA